MAYGNFQAREEYEWSHEQALEHARDYARHYRYSNPTDEQIMKRVERAKLYVKSREKRRAIYIYNSEGEDYGGGVLPPPHPRKRATRILCKLWGALPLEVPSEALRRDSRSSQRVLWAEPLGLLGLYYN